MRLRHFLAELRRRRVFKAALLYAVTGWAVIQVATTVFPLLHLPEWSPTLILALVALGFPVVLIGAWFFDLTRAGIVETPGARPEASDPKRSSPDGNGKAASPPSLDRVKGSSVAVLPFVNLSADPDNEYFADGITEDVIAHLSRIGALTVISRTSVMAFKKREQSLREIASALTAANVVEGSVRRVADRVRIVAQLINAETDECLWSETYDRKLTDVFEIQTDVALHIAGALQTQLSPEESSRIRKEPTRSVEAYQQYLKGRHSHVLFTTEGMLQAVDHFQHAIRLDPDYALAHASVAMTYIELAETGGLEPEHAYRRAKAAAATALALDPGLPEAHTVLGNLKLGSEFDWVGAEQEFKRALELSPNSADTYDLYGRMCGGLERYDEAIAMLKRAHELDPLAHRSDLATALLRAGRYDEALETARRAVESEPNYDRSRATLGWALMLKGMHAEGIAELQRAVSISPENTTWLAQLGQAYALTGNPDGAREVLRQLNELSKERYVSPFHLAYVYTGLGQHDDAIDALERAVEERSGAVYAIKGSFLFRALRPDPRFQALLRRINLN